MAQIRTKDGRVAGVTLASGESIDAPVVVTTAHPQISFLRLLDPADLPAEFVADIRGWRSRSGTVKINLALDRLPAFTSYPEPDPSVYGGTIVLAESLDDIETAFQQAVSGTPGRRCRSPTSASPACSTTRWRPPGSTSCRCSPSGCPAGTPTRRRRPTWRPTPTGCWPGWRAVAPGFTSSVLHRQVIGPHQMQEEYGLVGGNIFHGELSLGQMFHARPAAGYADLRTPVRGLYQAGSATHGGGGVTGIPGRNVVRQILADRRGERWRRRVRAPAGQNEPGKASAQS